MALMADENGHPVSITKDQIRRLRTPDSEENTDDDYTYKYDPTADASVNASESMKMDAFRLKNSPSATDLANRSR